MSGRLRMLIRPMRVTDASALARVHVRSWQVAYRGQLPDGYLDGLTAEIPLRTERWKRFIAEAPSRGRTLLAIEEDGRVVGFVNYGPPDNAATLGPHVGELYAIYLDPDVWKKGYGRALMETAVAGLTERGYTEAVLWVLESNARTRRFYEIAGWHPDGGRKTEHRGTVELREVRYRRELSPS